MLRIFVCWLLLLLLSFASLSCHIILYYPLLSFAFIVIYCYPSSSILGYLDAVRLLHSWLSLSFDWSSLACPRLHLVLAGIRHKGIPPSNTKKAAFGASDLLSIRQYCLQFGHASMQWAAWTAIIVSFWACLRSDNVVPKLASDFDSLRQMCLANMQWVQEGILVVLSKTKTRSLHGSALRVLVPNVPSFSDLCPVTAVKSLLEAVPSSSTGPLFQYVKQSSVVPLLYKNLRQVIRHWATAMNINLSKFGSQSARSGGATTAFRGGVDSIGIMKLGDWLSNCFLSYVRQDVVDLMEIQAKMLSALTNHVS